MIEDIINNAIETFKISKYEKALITKYKYNFTLSDKELLILNMLFYKIKLLRRFL